jgi:RHS repeat-associated protein
MDKVTINSLAIQNLRANRDATNSTYFITKPTGTAIMGWFEYEPFGAAIDSYGGAGTNPYWFAGRDQVDTAMNYYDNHGTNSNLVQMRGRMYNTRLQRFMSPDPIGYAGGQMNLYTYVNYVNNDPMNWMDPSGLKHGRAWRSAPRSHIQLWKTRKRTRMELRARRGYWKRTRGGWADRQCRRRLVHERHRYNYSDRPLYGNHRFRYEHSPGGDFRR